jgi:GTP-binding protein
MTGKTAKDLIIPVPPGTIIYNEDSGELLGDLKVSGDTLRVCKGGRGGLGNQHFATSRNQAPRTAEKGEPPEEMNIRLELKLLADVGIVGVPNAGKSSFLAAVTNATPKIADYPFTTLEPNLGIVRYKDYQSFTVADIPGIIEGAHQGKGLGIKFLRHIERTKILLFLIDITSKDYQKDFETLYIELKKYSKKLVDKKILVSFSKADLLEERELSKLAKTKIKKIKEPILIFSSVTGSGLQSLLDTIWEALNKQ